MDPIGNRPPTSDYGVIRNAQKAVDAGALRLIDSATGAASGGSTPPAAPVEAPPSEGSTIHVVA